MSCNRRMTLRKGKSSSNDGNRSISSFVQGRSKDVEIIENDEVVQVNDETVQRPLRRKKKTVALIEESENEDDNDSIELEEGLTKAEKQQWKEAIRQSRVEHEEYEKRREIYEKIFQNSKSEMAIASPADIQSSPASSSLEPSCVERPESPDLFGSTLQLNAEKYKKYDITSGEFSSINNDLSRMYQKSPLTKEISIQLSPIQRPLQRGKVSFKVDDKGSQDNELYSKDKCSNNVTIEDRDKTDSKKRKHAIEDVSDNDDRAKENIKSAESRKRQKTIEDNFPVLTAKKVNKELSKEPETKQFVVPDDDAGDSTESDFNRNKSTKKLKKYFRVGLKRKYKSRRPIKTIRDAIKARLFFTPPGIDQNLYAFAIMRMLDHTKDKVRKAYQINGQFVKWGLPIIPGPREDSTLDAKKNKRKSCHNKKELLLDSPEFKTRASRKLQNTLLKDKTSIKAEASNPKIIKTTEKESIERLTKSDDFVTRSDESDQDLTKSVFGNQESYPQSWNEYSSKTDSFKFGENVNISATKEEKYDVVKSDKNVNSGELKNADKGLTATLNPSHKDMPFDGSDIKLDRIQTATKLYNTKEKELFQDADSPHADMYFKDHHVSNVNSKQESMVDKKNPKKSKDHNVCTESCHSLGIQKPRKYKIQESDSDTNHSDGIDSSMEIGKLKVIQQSHKAAVIEEDGEEKACGRNSKGDIEMVDIEDLTPEGLKTSKPGDILSNSASKSGYLKVNRSENKPPMIQRRVTSAVWKAAEAAEKRMLKQEIVIKPSGSEVSIEDKFCQCPICYSHFPLEDIELHADTCNGTPPELDESNKHSRRVIAAKQGLESPSPLKSQEYGLKDLRVIVTRSPEAERIHKEQKMTGFKAKKNLSLTTKGKQNTEKVVVDMTSSDYDVDMTEQGSSKSHNKEDSQGGLHGFSWLTTDSQEARKKAKFKITYGGEKKKAPQKNPFSTLEYIPLREPSPSSDSESDHITAKLKQSHKTLPASIGLEKTANDPLSGGSQDKNYVDTDSDSSDADLLSNYGHKMPNGVKNTNEVLCPQKQDLTYKNKKEDDVHDANERALMELAGISSSSSSDDPKSKNIPQLKAFKCRHKRATISSDESDDEFMLCYACNQQVLKEVYCEHTNICTDQKTRSLSVSSSRIYSKEGNKAKSSTRNSTTGQTTSQKTSNTVEIDSDEIGNSPIKTFKLIGEGHSSTVDYENQFAFFEGNNSRLSSRRGSKRPLRGRGRGRFKNRYWRNKKKMK